MEALVFDEPVIESTRGEIVFDESVNTRGQMATSFVHSNSNETKNLL